MLRRCVGSPYCPERVNVDGQDSFGFSRERLERSFGGGYCFNYEGQTLERTLKVNGYFDEEVLRVRGRRHPMITVEQ